MGANLRHLFWTAITGLCLGCVLPCAPAAEPSSPQEPAATEFFESRIRPVLAERCYSCHSGQAKSLEGGLLLDSAVGLAAGGNRGPAIDIADAGASLLLQAIRYTSDELKMPPEDAGGPLAAEQVADFESWIRAGAPFPAAAEPLSDARQHEHARQHWAFQRVLKQNPPAVVQERWVKNDVDSFILAALEQAGASPSPSVDRRTLLRRAKYDLIGLPPTWDEIVAFENDSSPTAYADLIERLLASPHYGERWGRYWLDVARYADTKGYVYSREERRFVHAHVYRDWVVRSLNEDLPYDQFLVRQIAADQVEGIDRSSLAAMGFLTIGRRFINVKADIIDDRIDVVSRGLMGLTVACARCHDHKYDPVPTKDYYSLYGVFEGSSESTLPLATLPEVPSSPFEAELASRNRTLGELFIAHREELLERLRSMSAAYLAIVPKVATLPTEDFYMTMGSDEVNPVFVRQWHKYISRLPATDPIFAPWHKFANLPPESFAASAGTVLAELSAAGVVVNPLVHRAFAGAPPSSVDEVAQRYGKIFNDVHTAWRAVQLAASAVRAVAPPSLPDPAAEAVRQVLYGADSPIYLRPTKPSEAEFFFAEAAREELGQAQAKIESWIVESLGAVAHAVILEDRSQQQPPRVFVRGNPKNQGVEVPRQFLEVIAGRQRRPFEQGSGRLELARAIASPDNPLTARVMVNRIWAHHFGAGLVRTPSDFGLRSEPPSHPELLDYLATRFIESGWSIKAMHRLIMTSATYQQASDDLPESRAIDPDNRLWWRTNRRRLDFEAARDSLLAVAGRLDPSVGGRAVDLTSQPFSNRRTLYGYIDRLNLPTMFRAFDFASPDTHSPKRFETTVPQQALFMMNHPFVMDQARHLGAHPEVAAAEGIEAKVTALYRRIFARDPTSDEIDLARPFAEEQPVTAAATSPWSYGQARLDPQTELVREFTPLPYYTGETWHAGPQLPELKCGWAALSAGGGTPGSEPGWAVARRWSAPRSGTLAIKGQIGHTSETGDGIRARIVHNRLGELARWNLHKLSSESALTGVKVQQGDTLDFVVDGRQDKTGDEFTWNVELRMEADEAAGAAGAAEGASDAHQWKSQRDFSGPAVPPLTPWQRYVHVLVQSNEFMFVD